MFSAERSFVFLGVLDTVDLRRVFALLLREEVVIGESQDLMRLQSLSLARHVRWAPPLMFP